MKQRVKPLHSLIIIIKAGVIRSACIKGTEKEFEVVDIMPNLQ